MAVTVVDRVGQPQVVLRDSLAPELALNISEQKAYTAVSFNSATSALQGNFESPFSVAKVDGVLPSAGGCRSRRAARPSGASVSAARRPGRSTSAARKPAWTRSRWTSRWPDSKASCGSEAAWPATSVSPMRPCWTSTSSDAPGQRRSGTAPAPHGLTAFLRGGAALANGANCGRTARARESQREQA